MSRPFFETLRVITAELRRDLPDVPFYLGKK